MSTMECLKLSSQPGWLPCSKVEHRHHACAMCQIPSSHIPNILQLSCAVVLTGGAERPCCGVIRSQTCQQLAPFGA